MISSASGTNAYENAASLAELNVVSLGRSIRAALSGRWQRR
jgi:hypothetical protein